jgi:hypothetical protein
MTGSLKTVQVHIEDSTGIHLMDMIGQGHMVCKQIDKQIASLASSLLSTSFSEMKIEAQVVNKEFHIHQGKGATSMPSTVRIFHK